jgi:hypothetical protein
MNCINYKRLTTNGAQKSLLILIILLEISSYTYAQTEFAPIGAKWYYGYYKDIELRLPNEYFTYESVKDTIVSGRNCSKLNIWYYTLQKDSIYWGFDLIYSDSGRVYYFYKNNFLLLYDFNVKLGDTLNLLLFNPNIPGLKDLPDIHYVKYRVWETGTILVNNEQLRYYNLSTISIDSLILRTKQLYFNNRIYEKIGDTNFIYGSLISTIDWYPFRSYLRCYSDNNLQYHVNNSVPCDTIITGINEDLTEKSAIILYPNPVYEKFYIKLKTSHFNIRNNFKIIDLLGHEYKFNQEQLNDQTYLIDISELQAGTYFLIIIDSRPFYQKLIKL